MRSPLSHTPAMLLAIVSTFGGQLARAQALLEPYVDGGRLTPAIQEEKWGYRIRGEFTIFPRFEAAGPFSEGLAAVKVEGKFGYINRAGEFVIPPTFVWAGSFSERLAPVQFESGEFAYIEPNGEVQVFTVDAERIGEFSEGLAWIMRDERFGFVNREGEILIDPQFELVAPFSEGLAAAKQEGRYGYIDPQGAWSIPPQYEFAGAFSNGRAVVRRENRYGYIGREGESVIAPDFESALPFKQGVAPVQVEKRFRFINPEGTTLMAADFQAVMAYDARRLTGRTDDAIGVALKVEDGYVMEMRPVTWLSEVEFISIPAGAAVYCPTLWDFDHAPSVESLLTPENRVPEGDTNIKTKMNRWQEYRVIFVHGTKRATRRCLPAVHDRVNVQF